MVETSVLVAFVLAGIAGLGIGLGLVVGAFVARMLRRYIRDEPVLDTRRRDRRKEERDE